MADFHLADIQARTLDEIGFQVFLLAVFGVLDTIVKDDLRGRVLQQLGAVQNPDDNHRQQVDHEQLGVTRRKRHAIDDAEAHHHKEVGHLTDLDGLRSVTYHAEDGEETQGVGDVHLHVLHQRDDEEDDHGKHEEGEVIVLAVGLLVIEEVDDDPADEEVEHEADQGRQ